MASKKEMTKPGGGDLANFAGGQILSMDHEDLVAGDNDFGRQDLSIPFIRIVQSLSPYVIKGDAKYTKGVETGQIVETVTPKFFDGENGILVVPCRYQRSYTEWKPKRGGFVADHGDDPRILERTTKIQSEEGGKVVMRLDNGNDLEEAALYYVLYCDPTTKLWEPAVLALSGTQWKKARDWNTNMKRLRLTREDGSVVKDPLPLAGCYHFSTVSEKKDNYNFFGWKINFHQFTLALPEGSELVRNASDLRKMVIEGRVKPAQDDHEQDPLAGDNI